jgi:hypothetical protein
VKTTVPKIPAIAKTWKPKTMSKGLGNDVTHMLKKFFLYRNMFGNMSGAPNTDPMGNMRSSPEKPQENIGDVMAMASARRMGIL